MPIFKSISKSNKPNNSIVNYAINDVNTVAIVTKDGEIIDKKDVLVMYADSKSHKQLIDEQKKRLYFKVFIDTLGNIYNLTNNEISSRKNKSCLYDAYDDVKRMLLQTPLREVRLIYSATTTVAWRMILSPIM